VLPGFTSNVEFGKYYDDHRFVYGRPPGTPHTQYLDYHYRKAEEDDSAIFHRDEIPETLEDLMWAAVYNLYQFKGGFEKHLKIPQGP
jgi:hypothetical protein